MPTVSILGTKCLGHGAFPPRDGISGSPDVFINGKEVHSVGDPWNTHCGPDSCHPGAIADGSPDVLVNGKPIAREGDPIDCGSKLGPGSDNVFAN